MPKRVKRKIIRSVYRVLKYRPSSYPFISGDGFRKMADHIYEDGNCKINAGKIYSGDIVFLQTDLIEKFFNEIHPQIQNPYKLITHNCDRKITPTDLKFIDGKITKWFAQNVEVTHPKLFPIPIGIENKGLVLSGYHFLKNYKSLNSKNRKPKILFGFNVDTNFELRSIVLNKLRCSKNAEELERVDDEKYFDILNEYMFVASPEGNGPDCHRTWEAIALGIVPFVDSNFLYTYFKKLGAPIILTDSWDTIDSLEISEVNYSKYIECSREIVMEDYWLKIIKK